MAVVLLGVVWFVILPSGHLSDGCHVTLRSEASEAVPYAITFKRTRSEGTLRPGEVARPRLCWLSEAPSAYPEFTVTSEGRGGVSSRLDPYCTEFEVTLNDTAVRGPSSQACT